MDVGFTDAVDEALVDTKLPQSLGKVFASGPDVRGRTKRTKMNDADESKMNNGLDRWSGNSDVEPDLLEDMGLSILDDKSENRPDNFPPLEVARPQPRAEHSENLKLVISFILKAVINAAALDTSLEVVLTICVPKSFFSVNSPEPNTPVAAVELSTLTSGTL
uniref:Uncharacterized protein n=1 Tax=Timema douglasi TaxID=61478 RepID=A0A7R8VTG8_TIMDO|nr:unnamed protein product [Timema douglasi]